MVLWGLVGCALTPAERCAQVTALHAAAASMPETPERTQRMAVYASLIATYCSLAPRAPE